MSSLFLEPLSLFFGRISEREEDCFGSPSSHSGLSSSAALVVPLTLIALGTEILLSALSFFSVLFYPIEETAI